MILLVGEAPGGNAAHHGSSWARLAEVVGLVCTEALWERVRLVNVLARRPAKSGKGDAFPAATATRRVRALRRSETFAAARTVVLCGRRVARAFGEARRPYFEPFALSVSPVPAWAMIIPHPSGVNLWYNDSDNRSRARRELRAVLGLETL